jgi:16S rRNA (uracil1498-N3)-methyltransferase
VTTPRILTAPGLRQGERRDLAGDDAHYIRSVLRLKAGDPLLLFDGAGLEFAARIERIDPKKAVAEVLNRTARTEAGPRISLAQALPKGVTMDAIVRKAVEVGVSHILPFVSLRSVPRLSPSAAAAKADRWRKIALEAARQSGRIFLPSVEQPGSFRDVLDASAPADLKLIFWEEESRSGAREALSPWRAKPPGACFVLIGPEGGFAPGEVDAALSAGFRSVSIGPRVLKVETAVIAILSILQYELGSFGGGTAERSSAP